MNKDFDKNYELVPFNDITDEAREIAVRWVEGFQDAGGIAIQQKHKLASDIMNYAKQESVAFAEWIATYKTDSGDKIILCDGNYYWESDEEGSHPLDGKDLNTLYQQSKK